MLIRIPIMMLVLLTLLYACSDSDGGDKDTINVSEEGYTSINSNSLKNDLDDYPKGDLSSIETEGVLFLREEEKLAHDLTISFFDTWTQDVFKKVAKSEASHSEAVKLLIDRYSLADPAKGHGEGEFTNQELQSLLSELFSEGSASLVDALNATASAEELSLIDIQVQLNRVSANDDIAFIYDSLLMGSRNHLRVLVKKLETIDQIYTPRYLTMEEFDLIMSNDIEMPSE